MHRYLSHRYAPAVAIALCVLAALVLRIHNSSDYLVYPDSYQNLVAADNIARDGSVAGTLGDRGQSYPPSIWWTHPVYPSLIAGLHAIGVPSVQAGQIISLLASCLAIPLMYFVARRVWSSRLAGTIAAVLLTISFNHVVWSGFVLTESVGVIMVLAALWTLYYFFDHPSQRTAILAGIVFGLAVWTRYEYAVLVLPFAILAWHHLRTLLYLRWFIPASLMTGVTGVALWRPIQLSAATITSQVAPLAIVATALIAGLLIAWGARTAWRLKSASRTTHTTKIWRLSGASIIVYCGVAVIAVGLGSPEFPFAIFTSMNNFVIHEFPLLLLLATACFAAQRTPSRRRTIVAYALGTLVLFALYLRVNSGMERYLTHLLPLLIIIASFGGTWAIGAIKDMPTLRRRITIGIVAAVGLLQLTQAYHGIHGWQGGLWFQPGYEAIVAQKLPPLPPTAVIVSATPEPIYLRTGQGVITPFTAPPYIELPDMQRNEPIVIIADESMRIYFPEAYSIITSRLSVYQIDSFTAQTPFRDGSSLIDEQNPVRVYRLPVGALPASLTR